MADLKNITLPSDSHKEWTQVLAKAIQLVSVYYGLFLVVMGCACNPLSFIVMSRKSFRSSNLSLYLRILSALDLGNLLTMFFNIFMLRAFGIDFTFNLVGSRIRRFFGRTFLLLSSWILVIVTAERVVCIHKPHRYRTLCSKVVAKAVLATTVVIVCLINLLPTLTYKDIVVVDTMTNTTTVLRCQIQMKSQHLSTFNLGQMILTIIFFAVLPSLLLVVFNIFIIVGVARSRKNVMEMSNATIGMMTARQRRTSPERNRIPRHEASLTKTVLAINITFIVCNFPACAFGAALHFMAEDPGPIGLALTDLFLMLVYTNNAMNFVLYCVTGSKFRSEVKALFNDIIHCRCSV